MKKIIIILITILIAGCGGSDSSSKDIKEQDPNFFDQMWHINPDSVYQKNGIVEKEADIHLLKAWEKSYGDGIKVAVIDDCFDVEHKDLKENIYKTYDVNNQNSDVSGYYCHGTEVASVIGAVKNDFGIVGVAPKVKLILIKIDLEYSTESDYVEAFEYAKHQGARVINCSWGSNHEGEILSYEFQELKDAGIITVFASGNDGINLDTYGYDDESEDPNVIGVGATEGETNDVASYSNYGGNIDILAPGGSLELGILTLGDDNEYCEVTGTSYASPAVAGVVALMLSLDKTLTFDDIYKKITSTADKIGIENGANYINGFDIRRAYGKINATKVTE